MVNDSAFVPPESRVSCMNLIPTAIPLDVRAASANSAWQVISDSVVLSLLLHVDPLLLTAKALWIQG